MSEAIESADYVAGREKMGDERQFEKASEPPSEGIRAGPVEPDFEAHMAPSEGGYAELGIAGFVSEDEALEDDDAPDVEGHGFAGFDRPSGI